MERAGVTFARGICSGVLMTGIRRKKSDHWQRDQHNQELTRDRALVQGAMATTRRAESLDAWTTRVRALLSDSFKAKRRTESMPLPATPTPTARASMIRTRRLDLHRFDMQSCKDSARLHFDEDTGVYSGWLYVATEGSSRAITTGPAFSRQWKWKKSSRPVFHRRFMRLQELLCSFYDSDEDLTQPIEQYLILSVDRVFCVNMGFSFTDYDDRTVLVHTSMAADTDLWFDAFDGAVRTTRVSKSTLHSEHSNANTPAANGFPPQSPSYESRVSTYLSESLRRTKAALDEEKRLDVARTHSTWLHLHFKRPFGKKDRVERRYLVLSGTVLSCFAWNKEGELAEFTNRVSGYTYNPLCDPLSMVVHFAEGDSIRMSMPTRLEPIQEWVDHLCLVLKDASA